MHHDRNEDESSRSRWPEEVPGAVTDRGEVFDQEDYAPPAWDSWSDAPESFPPTGHGPAPASAPSAADGTDEDTGRLDDTTAAWRFPGALAADDPAFPVTPDELTDPITNALVQGLVVSGRYRLEEELVVQGRTHSWRAFDQKLSRPVMLHLLEANHMHNERVLTAARQSAIATDSRFLRVLDAINTDSIDVPGIGACVVSEFVPGQSLEKLLASGPLSGVEAAWVVRELADALAPLHAKGLFHQQLNPDTVIVTATGNVKIVGFLIEEAMFPATDRPFAQDDTWQSQQEADVRALGQLLYAMLVNRWPAPHSRATQLHWGMGAAPMDGLGWLTPRQVRAGVSPALDVVCDQVLSQVPRTGAAPITTAAQLDQALSRVLGTADAAADLEHRVRYPTVAAENTGPVRPQTQSTPAPVPVPAEGPPVPGELSAAGSVGGLAAGPRDPDEGLARPRPAPRTWLAVLVALVALTLVASLIAVGINNRRDDAASNQTSTATASGAPVAHPFAVVDDFDPEADGGNNEENPNRVADAHDGKPDTAWETLRYIGNARLGGLKPGVGLVVDLGQTVDVGRITLQLKGSPTGVRVLIPAENPDDAGAPAPMATIEDWTAIATNERAGETVTLTPTAVVKTRYVLVYLSSLPNVGGDGYRGGIAEIGVFDR